ncbi:hypothetical protein WL61_03220 [Burkholderia ubonensis]|uniref:hypothetical protein n=1 Tax=Burkholderia ubonensis TaxID=101571 RepID=UPI00075375A2|nr:hypothetical protein [Burkholderia ubonensis]KVO84029.1 hypothetical protein WJ80_18445 [Burkholderia ubonensis]KVR23997.1 hypothetical protein WK14_17270 [Burkholderia ubonensis]KWD25602.1 hypothetical protein WL61_03220 [Burkholderia ubonensis]KWD27611.1 hypothetical protein WL62_08525 [Burkholderia ubonensis]
MKIDELKQMVARLQRDCDELIRDAKMLAEHQPQTGAISDTTLEAFSEKIAEKLVAILPPIIPLEIDLWDTKTIATYLKRNPAVVRERICCLPSFPAAIRLPNTSGQRMHPLWKAVEVIAWAESHREHKTV